MNKRKVAYYDSEFDINMWKHIRKGIVGTGIILGFGIDNKPCGVSVGMFSTAIIELEDGSVKNIPVELIQFI